MTWTPDQDDPKRADALTALETVTGLTGLRRLRQHGRDPQTARLILERDGLSDIVITGGFDTLTSRAKTRKVLLATVGVGIMPMKPADWETVVDGLIVHATDVEEDADEQLSAQVEDWLEQYARGATSHRTPADAAPAAAQREPFRIGDELYVAASSFKLWLARDRAEIIPAHEIRSALRDLGFKATRVSFDAAWQKSSRKMTSASYYRKPTDHQPASDGS